MIESSRAPQCSSSSPFAGKIGIARSDITPPVGIYARNWGAARHDTATSIHRPLTLNALVLTAEGGENRLVMVDADLGWWHSQELFREFQGKILKAFSLQPSELLIALSHTHAAPPLRRLDEPLAGAELLDEWLEQVSERMISTIRNAITDSRSAIMDWNAGRCGLASVRDLPDPRSESDPESAAERLLCGYNPAVAADDTLVMGRIAEPSGELRGVIVNYACHPTTLAWENRAISPDFVGAMRETIEESTGANVFFLQGMSGDLAPKHQYVGQTDVADRHGRQLGFAALATLSDMEPPGQALCYEGSMESGAPLALWRNRIQEQSPVLRAAERTIELPMKDWPTAAELESQRIACKDRVLAERLRRKRDIRRSLGDAQTVSLSIYAWRVGDAILVATPGEAYSQLQRDLRSRFPNTSIACMNLVNGSIGYLPRAADYDRDLYAAWQTPLARGSLEQLNQAMTQVIEHLLA